jgi:hypothetical protein
LIKVKHFAMKAYEGVDIWILICLSSALVGGEWSGSSPARFTPGEKPPVSVGYEVEWTPEPVWTTWRRKNS